MKTIVIKNVFQYNVPFTFIDVKMLQLTMLPAI